MIAPPPAVCWCGASVQGADAPDHYCRQCARHCELERYRRGLPVLDPRVGRT